MLMNAIYKKFSVLLLSIFAVVSLLQISYPDQYKYYSIDLFSMLTDSAVECLSDPEQSDLTIRKILHSFKYPVTHRAPHVSCIPHPDKQDIKQFALQQVIRISTITIISSDITPFHPFISSLKKSHPAHSIPKNDPFPIYC